VHLALASSSIIFQVIKRRMMKFPMIMWNEYRLHAIVFTLRCFSTFSLGFFVKTQPWLAEFVQTLPGRFFCCAVCLAHHVVADLITKWHGTEGVTSVRVARSKKTGQIAYARVKLFYAFYQFLAITSHITPDARTMDLGFNALIAIQSSAFLMTLCRKNIITFRMHGIIYTLCLVLSTSYMVRNWCRGGYGVCLFLLAATMIVFQLRVTFRVNKYVLWGLFVFATFPDQQGKIIAYAQGAVDQAQALCPTLAGPVSSSVLLPFLILPALHAGSKRFLSPS